MSYPLAGPERSQQTATAGHIRRKPRKLRDKFESIPQPRNTFYNNDLVVAVGEGFEPSLGLYTLNRFSNPSIAVSGNVAWCRFVLFS